MIIGIHFSLLLGHEHHAHPAFADLLEQLVRANDGTLGVADCWMVMNHRIAGHGRLLQKAAGVGVGRE